MTIHPFLKDQDILSEVYHILYQLIDKPSLKLLDLLTFYFFCKCSTHVEVIENPLIVTQVATSSSASSSSTVISKPTNDQEYQYIISNLGYIVDPLLTRSHTGVEEGVLVSSILLP